MCVFYSVSYINCHLHDLICIICSTLHKEINCSSLVGQAVTHADIDKRIRALGLGAGSWAPTFISLSTQALYELCRLIGGLTTLVLYKLIVALSALERSKNTKYFSESNCLKSVISWPGLHSPTKSYRMFDTNCIWHPSWKVRPESLRISQAYNIFYLERWVTQISTEMLVTTCISVYCFHCCSRIGNFPDKSPCTKLYSC